MPKTSADVLSTSRKQLWKVLQEYGVDGGLPLVVKSLYSCSEFVSV